jgi:hypothetical protein
MAADSETSSFARGVVIVVAALALYVLSIGPVNRYDKPFEPHPWMEMYRPLFWIGEHCEPIAEALRWYEGLWIPRIPDDAFAI